MIILFKRYDNGFGNEYESLYGPFNTEEDAIKFAEENLNSKDVDVDDTWGCADYFIDRISK